MKLLEEDESADMKPASSRIASTAGNVLTMIFFLIYFVMVCYALGVSNTAEVQEACGSNLWKFVLAHLVVAMGLALVIVVSTAVSMICCFGLSDAEEPMVPFVFVVVSAFVLVLYASLFIGLGYPIVHDAMSSTPCLTELSNVSFTKTPLLGIFGCMYLALDALILIVIALGLVAAACVL